MNPITTLEKAAGAVIVLLLAALMLYGVFAYGRHTGGKPYIDAIKAQKIEAGKLLAVETEKARAASQALTDFKLNQEIKDAENQTTVERLALQLRSAAGPARRLRDPAGRGGGGGGAKDADPASPGSGAEDGADGAGLLSADLTELLLGQAQIADTINNAYASCRADAFSLRGVLK